MNPVEKYIERRPNFLHAVGAMIITVATVTAYAFQNFPTIAAVKDVYQTKAEATDKFQTKAEAAEMNRYLHHTLDKMNDKLDYVIEHQ